MVSTEQPLDAFLSPLDVDAAKIHKLAKSLASTFTRLAKESKNQFLSTPISEEVLRFEGDVDGQYLAIDIGGTNLRVGFIELLSLPHPQSEASDLNGKASTDAGSNPQPSVQRHLEKSWPIGEQLKNNKAEDLFAWIGTCIAEIVREGCRIWDGKLPDQIPLGVTFSFPMIQHTLSKATLMSMGKGFAITSNLDLGKLLLEGYESVRDPSLPRIRITAIVNDAVATLVSFAYQFRSNARRKAAMAVIVGTGCNATIPLALNKLHPSKRPTDLKVLDDRAPSEDLKITVNTEWSINGTAVPLKELNFITYWDTILDSQGEVPGFQPFEYMTAGRYLGELGRLIILDYFTNHLHIPISSLPAKLLIRHGITTTFLGNLGPHLSNIEPSMLRQLESELPSQDGEGAWQWTQEAAEIVFKISKAIQVRAAGMAAAAIIGLLACADEVDFTCLPVHSPRQNGNTAPMPISPANQVEELMVGYTGGCIVHFQDYLEDCQRFLDVIMDVEFAGSKVPRVLLTPCHDGGIIGAGILAGTVMGIMNDTST
ncbi:Phosphotransferase [Venustampulla echinocandica]|uniref:Phosphotransferase n=1 Tax=Venustampulla echinocandica TaxID=2656787 RepID=A0A370TA75_9HELO|nr:Phosphotransferase [Venustampulla echinocandica]RDL30713.1 Phosphotransferase [Venustampulla echinocandica]